MNLKRRVNTPPHLLLDNTLYFITGAIYLKRPLLAKAEVKQQLLGFIQRYFQEYDWELHHWVILDNHYHLLGKSARGADLPLMLRKIHSQSARQIQQYMVADKPIWWNYWDYCPRDERDYFIRLNYLLANPVKHGYVLNLYDYEFSSFHALFAEMGREQLAQQFREYGEYKTLVLSEAHNDDF